MNKQLSHNVKRLTAVLLAVFVLIGGLPSTFAADLFDTVITASADQAAVTTYQLLKAAFTLGGEIKLGADITIGDNDTSQYGRLYVEKDIVLDLAGHTLAYEVNDGFCAVQVGEGNFTLNDSVGGGKITASDSSYVVFTYGSSDEHGDITINGGTLQNLREDINL